MPFKKITEYRKHAEECSRQSELTTNAAVKSLWLNVAYEWQALADNLEEENVYYHINRAA